MENLTVFAFVEGLAFLLITCVFNGGFGRSSGKALIFGALVLVNLVMIDVSEKVTSPIDGMKDLFIVAVVLSFFVMVHYIREEIDERARDRMLEAAILAGNARMFPDTPVRR